MSRGPRKKHVAETKPPKPEPQPVTPKGAARRIAQKIVNASATLTPEEADARALELISDAAMQMDAKTRMIRKPKSRGGWLSFLKPKDGSG